ncbi:ankyrin repeat domain-containing protein [Maioricimonas sp. JC845]|uniref:ankyrin repeat domain-containing protein n=1 Tax=Maioricimonas sp. JC845 TaxID=3232138 RepID=UPI00345AC549
MSYRLLMAARLLVLLLACTATTHAGDTPLVDAAEAADWKQVTALLESGDQVNAAQVDGTTALHWAVWHDATEAALQLIEAGADIDARNRYDVTPLSLACQNGNGTLVAKLLQAGADANTALPGGETALMTACRTGRTEAVQALLKHGADVNATERNGQTALMWAAAEGHADVVRLLLEAGADIDTELKSGFTPLFLAVREGRQEVVDVLLEAGQDVNERMTPERRGGRFPRNGMSPLLLAVENGHFELAAHLLERGADPNDQRSGFTALHAITWVRKPNRGDGIDGTPPPIGSGRMTSLQLVRKLVEHGADVNARLKRGRSGRGRLNQTAATPFLFAADTADVPLMELLLDLGADPTIPNADNCPPLLAAAGLGTLAPGEEAGTEEESLQAVRLLLDLGADVNAVDDNGETAMHGAAYASFPKMVQLLAESGADISIWNRKNKYGWTPLLIAEGHRPGNFKPAAATLEAVRTAMRAAGVEPPPPTPRKQRVGYD